MLSARMKAMGSSSSVDSFFASGMGIDVGSFFTSTGLEGAGGVGACTGVISFFSGAGGATGAGAGTGFGAAVGVGSVLGTIGAGFVSSPIPLSHGGVTVSCFDCSTGALLGSSGGGATGALGAGGGVGVGAGGAFGASGFGAGGVATGFGVGGCATGEVGAFGAGVAAAAFVVADASNPFLSHEGVGASSGFTGVAGAAGFGVSFLSCTTDSFSCVRLSSMGGATSITLFGDVSPFFPSFFGTSVDSICSSFFWRPPLLRKREITYITPKPMPTARRSQNNPLMIVHRKEPIPLPELLGSSSGVSGGRTPTVEMATSVSAVACESPVSRLMMFTRT